MLQIAFAKSLQSVEGPQFNALATCGWRAPAWIIHLALPQSRLGSQAPRQGEMLRVELQQNRTCIVQCPGPAQACFQLSVCTQPSAALMSAVIPAWGQDTGHVEVCRGGMRGSQIVVVKVGRAAGPARVSWPQPAPGSGRGRKLQSSCFISASSISAPV